MKRLGVFIHIIMKDRILPIINRILLCSRLCCYFLSTLLLLYCVLQAHIWCKRFINILLH